MSYLLTNQPGKHTGTNHSSSGEFRTEFLPCSPSTLQLV